MAKGALGAFSGLVQHGSEAIRIGQAGGGSTTRFERGTRVRLHAISGLGEGNQALANPS